MNPDSKLFKSTYSLWYVDTLKVKFQVLQTMSFSGKNVQIGLYLLAKIYNCIKRYFVLRPTSFINKFSYRNHK